MLLLKSTTQVGMYKHSLFSEDSLSQQDSVFLICVELESSSSKCFGMASLLYCITPIDHKTCIILMNSHTRNFRSSSPIQYPHSHYSHVLVNISVLELQMHESSQTGRTGLATRIFLLCSTNEDALREVKCNIAVYKIRRDRLITVFAAEVQSAKMPAVVSSTPIH
jgi:hypothetical protein